MDPQEAGNDVGRQETWMPAARPAGREPPPSAGPPKVLVEDFGAAFGGAAVLQHLDLEIRDRERLAIIGPASSGKTTFLRSLNRLNDLDPRFSHTGRILLDGKEIHDADLDAAALRRRIGMVYAVPIPLPWSIHENLTYGPRLAGVTDRARLDEVGILAHPLQYHTPKLPGLGDVNWGRFFSVLSDIGYDGPVCIEVEDRAYEKSRATRQASLKQSGRFLRQFV